MTDKDKIKELKPFDAKSYNPIDLDRLVIYATVELEKLGVELSLENIIVGAFNLFPKKFSLSGYLEFPDATRVEKCLWRCKSKKRQWIGGKTPHGYLITDKTRLISVQTEAQLSNTVLKKEQKTPSRLRRKEGILKETKDSPAYSKYVSGKAESISEADVCYLLQGTLDSPRELLRENFLSLKKFAKELECEDVLIFLNLLENRFSFLFNTSE
jgi:hypothetical protein